MLQMVKKSFIMKHSPWDFYEQVRNCTCMIRSWRMESICNYIMAVKPLGVLLKV